MDPTDDYTIRYEGTQYVLYLLLPELDEKGRRKKQYLGTYRHKEWAVKAMNLRLKSQTA